MTIPLKTMKGRARIMKKKPKLGLVERLAKKLAHASSQSEGHRQIEAGAFFAYVGGSEIDSYSLSIRKFQNRNFAMPT